MNYNSTEEQLAALEAKYTEFMKVMASCEGPSLLSFDWVKKNVLQINDDEG